jgi:homoserine kinase type II
MAVFTPVSSEELSAYLSSYDIGNLVSHEGIEAGVSNTNFFVTTDKGRYVLTLFEPRRVKAEDIPFYIDYTVCLEEHGVPCPKTLVRKNGTTLGGLNGRPSAIFSVLEGTGASVKTLDAAMCEQAGEMLAKMHLSAQKLIKTAPNHFGLKRWRDWLTLIGPDMNKISDGLYKFAADEYDWIASRWPSDLPSGAIHADYFPDNVFFKDGKLTGVIDFHFVCTDLFAYDLAIAINAWSFDEHNVFRPERQEAMLRGYQSMRPLSQAEMISMPVLLRAAALRFLLSRIEEQLNWKPDDFMKPHDPMVFEKRLKHFQLTGLIIP